MSSTTLIACASQAAWCYCSPLSDCVCGDADEMLAGWLLTEADSLRDISSHQLLAHEVAETICEGRRAHVDVIGLLDFYLSQMSLMLLLYMAAGALLGSRGAFNAAYASAQQVAFSLVVPSTSSAGFCPAQ
eukprot:2844-Hanusia_phi.AAC.2